MKDKIISFDSQLSELDAPIDTLSIETDRAEESINDTGKEINEVLEILNTIPGVLRPVPDPVEIPEIKHLNVVLRDLSDKELSGTVSLSGLDTIVSIIAGVIASIIDIVFVGTPEVVKVYKKGENFDGSILTALFRKIGSGDNKLSEMFKWLSDKCKVPYDISAMKDVVAPDNHRLRNFAHDPLVGLLFAVADIILGTATVIDNDGRIRILVNNKNQSPIQKYLAVLYYLGHLLSDVCTARGLPIPGFFLTQFFAGNKDSIARVAEAMYKDGYDVRHLASMSTPVIIKNLIINGYLWLTQSEQTESSSIAMKEIQENKRIAYKYKLRLVSDAVCCSGNVLKFFIPPTSGNMTALNLPEWAGLLTDTIITLKYQLREKNVEQVIRNREIINDNWIKLAMDFE